MTKRWKDRPPGSNWGDFGPDDELGRLNLLTPKKVLEGIREVREGRVFSLSLPLDYPGERKLNPRRFPPRLHPVLREGLPVRNFPMEIGFPERTDVMNDEVMHLCSQYSTQWDALCHAGSQFDADGDGTPEFVYYNGFRAGEHVTGPVRYTPEGACEATGQSVGADALGIERMAETGVQGRGVMIDLHAHYGRERQMVGYDELMEVCAKDGVTVEPGDMLCFHTGFADMLLEMKKKPDEESLQNSCAVLDGRDERLLEWITACGAAVLIADNYAVEAYPPREGTGRCALLPLHEHCLFKLGIHLGELWCLGELAAWLRANGRYRFLLTAPPLRMPGAAGSPTTPVATV
ncbi:MAG: cyclase family protein [Alphaproteobacteria bacterium]